MLIFFFIFVIFGRDKRNANDIPIFHLNFKYRKVFSVTGMSMICALKNVKFTAPQITPTQITHFVKTNYEMYFSTFWSICISRVFTVFVNSSNAKPQQYYSWFKTNKQIESKFIAFSSLTFGIAFSFLFVHHLELSLFFSLFILIRNSHSFHSEVIK